MTCNMISIIFHRHLHLLSWKNETIGACLSCRSQYNQYLQETMRRCALSAWLFAQAGSPRSRSRWSPRSCRSPCASDPVEKGSGLWNTGYTYCTSSRNAEKQCLSQKVCYQSTWARKLRYITFIYNLARVSDMERCCLVIASAVSVPISVSISVSVSVPLVPCIGLGRMRLKSNSAAMGTNECATEQDPDVGYPK